MDKQKTFEELKLNELLIESVYLYGFTSPSPIQIKGIESINTGKDCLLQSQSGTGKTATYLLGVLNRIEDNDKTQAIIDNRIDIHFDNLQSFILLVDETTDAYGVMVTYNLNKYYLRPDYVITFERLIAQIIKDEQT